MAIVGVAKNNMVIFQFAMWLFTRGYILQTLPRRIPLHLLSCVGHLEAAEHVAAFHVLENMIGEHVVQWHHVRTAWELSKTMGVLVLIH